MKCCNWGWDWGYLCFAFALTGSPGILVRCPFRCLGNRNKAKKKKKVKGCQRGQKRQSDEFFRCYTTVTQWPGVYSHKTMQEKKQERKPDPNLRTVCLLCKHGNVFVGPELLLRVRYQTRHLKDAISILIAFTPNSSNLRPFFFLLLLANNCGWLCLGLNYRCRQLQRQWCVCIQAAW